MPRRLEPDEVNGVTVVGSDPLGFPGETPKLMYLCIINWVQLEVKLGHLIVDFLGSKTPESLDFINGKLHSSPLRKKLEQIAKDKILDPEVNHLFSNVMEAIEAQGHIRNKILHWNKATSSKFPNAVLFEEPKYIWYSSIIEAKHRENITNIDYSNDEIDALWERSSETRMHGTWVFFEEDFKSLLDNISIFEEAFFELMWWHRGGLLHYVKMDWLRNNFSNIDHFKINFDSEPIREI